MVRGAQLDGTAKKKANTSTKSAGTTTQKLSKNALLPTNAVRTSVNQGQVPFPSTGNMLAQSNAASAARSTGGGGGGGGGSYSGYSGGGSGGGGVASAAFTGTAGATAAPPDAAPAPSDDDWLAGDSTYQAALAALKKTLSGYQADTDKSKTNYTNDYNSSLKNLGWEDDTKSWNQDDQNTAYGRSYNNQLNDYASRDMLQSSFYGTSLQDLLRQFNDQKTDIDGAKSKYFDDLASTLAQQTNENDISQQQARAESIARKAAGVMAY